VSVGNNVGGAGVLVGVTVEVGGGTVVFVAVHVGVAGTGVLVEVRVAVGVFVARGVGVLVRVAVGVLVARGVGVFVARGVGVFVVRGVGVLVGVVPPTHRLPIWRSVAQKSPQSTRPSLLMSNAASWRCCRIASAIRSASRQSTRPSPLRSAHRGATAADGGDPTVAARTVLLARAAPGASDTIRRSEKTNAVIEHSKRIRTATPIVN
jgi:hypothetical protein